MNNFNVTIVYEVTSDKGEKQRHVDKAGRNLYKITIREGRQWLGAINLPHGAIVALVQKAVATVPAEDPQPPLLVPPLRHA